MDVARSDCMVHGSAACVMVVSSLVTNSACIMYSGWMRSETGYSNPEIHVLQSLATVQ